MEELRGGADVVLKKIMRQAAAERASDVHIEPGASSSLRRRLLCSGASTRARRRSWRAGCRPDTWDRPWCM